jgi:uncharacterized membrane protein
VVIADFLFTATAVVLQPVTGLLLVREVGYDLRETWIVLSILLYLVTGAFWLPVVWIQARIMRLASSAEQAGGPMPQAYAKLFRVWFWFGFPAFAAVLAILWLMIARPDFRL